jgi:hypothetical protein
MNRKEKRRRKLEKRQHNGDGGVTIHEKRNEKPTHNKTIQNKVYELS